MTALPIEGASELVEGVILRSREYRLDVVEGVSPLVVRIGEFLIEFEWSRTTGTFVCAFATRGGRNSPCSDWFILDHRCFARLGAIDLNGAVTIT